MRLLEVHPIYFRCYSDATWVNLDSELVVLFGPNGYGKSSLVESIEWLLHGRTKRRKRGQDLSKRDYKWYYQNAHAPDEKTTAVEAKVQVDGAHHEIRRELHVGKNNKETTKTFVDGNEASFASIGLREDPLYDPVIPQHALQDFLLSEPKERRNKVSAAFGLDPLVQFSDALTKARNTFQRSVPDRVASAQKRLQTALSGFKNAPDSSSASKLRKNWEQEKFDPAQDEARLTNALRDYLNSDLEDLDELEDVLRSTRAHKASRVFKVDLIRPTANWQAAKEELVESRREIAEDRLPTLHDHLGEYTAAAAAKYSGDLLSFWKEGLRVKEDGSDTCPMCEEATLGEEKQNEIKQRLEDSNTFSSARQSLKQTSSALAQDLRTFARSARSIFPNFVTKSSRGTLLDLFEESSTCKTFLEVHDGAEQAVQQVENDLKALADRVEKIPQMAADPEQVDDVPPLVEEVKNELREAAQSVAQNAEDYAESFDGFKERLQDVISKAGAVKEADAFLSVIERWDAVETLAAYHTLLDDSLEVEQNLKDHLQKKQEQLFKTRGQEIDKWYEMMNPDADVTFSHMKTGAASLRLFAEAFGEKLNAASALSQCQANCLGLSIHFMRALSSDSPFDFLVLDDPVQSMDDDHCQALMDGVVEELLEEESRQLIICSHLQELIDELRYLHRDRDPRQLRITDLRKEGPVIELAETVKSCIEEVKRLQGKNEDHRRLAMQVLRRAVELLVRRTCEEYGDSRPPRDATFGKDLEPHFRSCPKTTQAHADRLKDTVDFLNPASHTQRGWGVPTKSQISPHLDRVRTYAKRHYQVWEA